MGEVKARHNRCTEREQSTPPPHSAASKAKVAVKAFKCEWALSKVVLNHDFVSEGHFASPVACRPSGYFADRT
jgi:hypothetical protein